MDKLEPITIDKEMNKVLEDFCESASMLTNVEIEKLPLEDQFSICLSVMELNNSLKKFDESTRRIIVKAMSIGAYKTDD